jgi:hypothetical protein
MPFDHPVANRKFLGSYDAGMHFVDLYARSGGDAEFRMQPEKGKNARITVGIDACWWVVFSSLTHEITELTYTDMGLRMVPGPDISRDNGNYTFVMTHTQYSEAMARVGLYLSMAVPDLQQYWKKKQPKGEKNASRSS